MAIYYGESRVAKMCGLFIMAWLRSAVNNKKLFTGG